MSILADYYTPDIVQDPKYKFSQSGLYYAPQKNSYEEYVEFIKVFSSVLISHCHDKGLTLRTSALYINNRNDCKSVNFVLSRLCVLLTL